MSSTIAPRIFRNPGKGCAFAGMHQERGSAMELDVLGPVIVTLAVFVAMIAFLKWLKSKGKSFTFRVFTALGLGVVLGVAMQFALGRDSDAATTALDWMSLVGTGYIDLLRMLVMPLVFVAIVGAFTRTKATENLGKMGGSVLAVLLGTVAIAALFGWATIAFSGLAGADFVTQGSVDASKLEALETRQATVADQTIPATILSFIPTNFFADLAGSRSTSTIAVVIFSAIVGLAYLKLCKRDSKQAQLFHDIIDSLYGIVMCIVKMVVGLTPYGVLALITKVLATSDFQAILDLGKFIIFSYVAIIAMFIVHLLIISAQGLSPITYLKKAFPVLSFAFVSRTSAGALPMNIETQSKAFGVDEATANFAASFGMSIGQNGCAGIYPAMMATLIAPTVGINVFDPTWVIGLIAVIVISSFGVAGVGGGATFASLIVLGTMGLPIEIVGLMASVEPLIDMGRTALNVSDAMTAGVTSSNVLGGLDRDVYNDPEARIVSSEATEA